MASPTFLKICLQVMGWDKLASDRVHLSFGEILSVLGANSPGVAIHTANRLCVNNKIDIHDSFKREISLHYKVKCTNESSTTCISF